MLNEILNKMVAFVHETLFIIMNKPLLKIILNVGSPTIHLQPFVEKFIEDLKANLFLFYLKALNSLEEIVNNTRSKNNKSSKHSMSSNNKYTNKKNNKRKRTRK